MNLEEKRILKENDKYHTIKSIVPLPSVYNAGIIGLDIVESLTSDLSPQEEAFFLPGFQECVKYLLLQNDAWAASKSADKASRT